MNTLSSVNSLKRAKELSALDYERRVDSAVIGGLSKAVLLERLRGRRILTMKVKPNNFFRKQSAAEQVRRAGRALGKPMCCGEPRQLYAKYMLEALEIILHRRGLK